MYHFIVGRIIRGAFASFSRGDPRPILARFSDEARFTFAGEHALAADLNGREAVRGWFERLFELLPGLQFEVQDVLVRGWPWDTVVMTRFVDRLPRIGYENFGTQYLRLRWGRVVEDHILVDTQRLAAVLADRRLAPLMRQ
jgi:ketosteroid isomerase-like protein